MSLRGCLRGVKYSVFLLNFVIWVTGMAMLVSGIYMRMDVHLNHVMSAAYVDNVYLFHRMCYALIGSGAMVTFIGFLGCCSAFQESSCMLGTFFTILILLVSGEILVGVWAFLYVDEARLPVPSTFSNYVKHVYGVNSLRDEPIDHVQQLLNCCGGFGPSDWVHSSWFNRTPTVSRHHSHHFLVPESCCSNHVANSTETVVSSFPSSDGLVVLQCRSKHRVVFQANCGRKLIEWLDGHIFAVIIVTLALVGIQPLHVIGVVLRSAKTIGRWLQDVMVCSTCSQSSIESHSRSRYREIDPMFGLNLKSWLVLTQLSTCVGALSSSSKVCFPVTVYFLTSKSSCLRQSLSFRFQ